MNRLKPFFILSFFLLFLLSWTQCTNHSIKFNDPTLTDKIIRPLLSIGVADFYANGYTDIRSIIYDKLKYDQRCSAFFTDVFIVKDEMDLTSDIVIKGEVKFNNVIGDVSPGGVFAALISGSIFTWMGVPLFVTRLDFTMDIALFENGECKKTYSYSDYVSQHRPVYAGKIQVDYDMIFDEVLLAWIADLGELKIYEYK
jgi:hypothetical protein